MKITCILNNIKRHFTHIGKNRSEYNLDAKYWIQKILLKNQLKSLNKSN